MQDSITIADVGSIVKVSGSRIATPLGPPRPGNTPTKIPSTNPNIISSSVFQVSSTAKPCIKRPNASITRLPSGDPRYFVIASEAKQSMVQQSKNGLLRRFAPLHKRFAFVAGNDGRSHAKHASG